MCNTISFNANDTCTRNQYQKPVLVSGASDMELGTEFFWYQFLVTYIFMPIYGTSFLVWVFKLFDFWCVYHVH